MNTKAADLLEYPKIKAMLATHCAFSASKELATALEPIADPSLVAHRQALTAEAVRLLDLRPQLGVGGARDVRSSVDRAQRGGVVDPLELRAIATTIVSGRRVRGAIVKVGELVPGLADLASLIVDCPSLDDDINRCLSEDGVMLDSASPELARLRVGVRQSHDRLLTRLQEIISGSTYRTALQEPLITMREGRYVVPVRSDSRGQLRGLIHDQSASGQTVYVEPFETVDLANRWRQLQIEEAHEVQRILQQLSDSVAAHADALTSTVAALAEIDLQLAKARLAERMRAVEPVLEAPRAAADQRGLRLINARHPLLGANVVPISVWLGDEFNVMVITGPNTGGKTVGLKTVGLLTLMAQAGLFIPADPGARIHVFEDIFADIGDEQSIEQSLSTFSSHMRQVVRIVGAAGVNTLVLLDEVGAGTDPAEGSALARAVLGRLLGQGAWVIATTHYTELKAFAHDTPGVSNASVEFDPETLGPTYRLQIGLPGRSNALAIARRLGLDSAVVEAAENMIDPNQRQVEDLLIGIQAEHEKALAERTRASEQRHQLERLRTELERRLREIDRERQDVLDRARRDAETDLAELRDQLRQAAAQVDRADRTRDELLATARELDRFARRPSPGPAKAVSTPLPMAPIGVETGVGFRLGDAVRVRSLQRDGEIVAFGGGGGSVDVQLGSFKLRVAASDLDRIQRAPQPPSTGGAFLNLGQRPAPAIQLDMRGWRVEQVAPELDRYLNDAFMAGLPSVRIIHGKGTGALRQVVHEFLSESSLVRAFNTAERQEGGEGATVVALAV